MAKNCWRLNSSMTNSISSITSIQKGLPGYTSKSKHFNYNISVLFFSNTLFFFVTILIICWSLLSLDKVLNSCFSYTLLTQNKKKKSFKTITVHLSYRQFKIFTWNVLFIECQMDPVSHCFLSNKTDLINPLP